MLDPFFLGLGYVFGWAIALTNDEAVEKIGGPIVRGMTRMCKPKDWAEYFSRPSGNEELDKIKMIPKRNL